ncbi:MAG: hypothetical protein WA252_13155 [Candidatus Sulfotelmatobacter sp.]
MLEKHWPTPEADLESTAKHAGGGIYDDGVVFEITPPTSGFADAP